MNARLPRLTGIMLACLLPCASAFAQAVSTASIAGTVRDESGGVLPGVTVTATQTATGLVRTAVTDGTGGFTLPSLPVGPYRVEFALQGFRTHVQTGIVLQVNATPTVNATMGIGNLSETVRVEAAAPLIETRNPSIGQVMDNQRVVELPLNGRQTLDLVYLTGMATPSGTLGGARGTAFGSPQTISVAGGLANGAIYLLDGGTHNDPFNNASIPFPFPEALQEFKVETSALPAQYGQHSSSAINAVTKSGTNSVNGSLFEFLRDDALNATDPFSPLGADGKRRSDGLNRHQFGGTVGGPLILNKLFYFAGYQRTRIRRIPPTDFQFVPTPAMLAGDFTAITSPACNAGRTITLRAPFANNRISPTLFSPASVKLASLLPVPDNPCGQVFFDRNDDGDEHMLIARVDYTATNNHSIFGRLEVEKLDTPGNYDGKTLMSFSAAAFKNRVSSLVFGDSLLIGASIVNSLRVTVNLGDYGKTAVPLVDYNHLGIKATPVVPGVLRMGVTGGFSLNAPSSLPGETPTKTYQIADDITLLRGAHQFGIGVNFIQSRFNSASYLAASGNVNFSGQVTTLGLADFLLGRAASFSQGTVSGINMVNNYVGVYVQDSWRVSPNFSVSAGLRWDPYQPNYSTNDQMTHFDRARFDAGLRSKVYTNAPVGLVFPGDEGIDNKVGNNQWWNFAPRLGVVWDRNGEGRETLRASYGRFFDQPHLQAYSILGQMAPFGNTITLTNLPSGWDDPYVAYPGGNPIPITLAPNMQFPLSGAYTTFPRDVDTTNLDQWNASYQRQVGSNWMVSGNYLGTVTRQFWALNQINPAVYVPGASTPANLNQRRVLSLQNPTQGAYYASVAELDTTGTASYNALLLSVQRRRASGFSLQGNYTISRCITDPINFEPVSGQPYMIPGNRSADRGRCQTSSNQIVNVSTVYELPEMGSNAAVRALTSGWQLSGILTARSGSYFTVTTGVDTALTGQAGQRANQILDDPFMAVPSFSQWLNPAAFQAPREGTYGTMPIDAIQGPGRWNVDMGLSRSLRMGERQVQLRFEAFNVFNRVNPSNPVSAMNNPNFGRIISTAAEPRILQLALKFVF